MLFTQQTGSSLELNGNVLLPSAYPPHPAAARCLRDPGPELPQGHGDGRPSPPSHLQPRDTSGERGGSGEDKQVLGFQRTLRSTARSLIL